MRNTWFRAAAYLVTATILIFGFQNCSGSSASSTSINGEEPKIEGTLSEVPCSEVAECKIKCQMLFPIFDTNASWKNACPSSDPYTGSACREISKSEETIRINNSNCHAEALSNVLKAPNSTDILCKFDPACSMACQNWYPVKSPGSLPGCSGGSYAECLLSTYQNDLLTLQQTICLSLPRDEIAP